MQGNNLSTALSPFARMTRRFRDGLRRWVNLYGQQPALAHSADIDAYVLLAQLRRRRAASGGDSTVIPLPGCIDDAHANLRISM